MRLPIALALGWPDRVADAAPALDWTAAHSWELRPLDEEAFPAVRLAKAAGRAGRCRPAIFNAANEECVAGFVAGRLPFLGIVATVERVLAEAPDFAEPGTVGEVLDAESWARTRARELVATSETSRRKASAGGSTSAETPGRDTSAGGSTSAETPGGDASAGGSTSATEGA
jgi:1-deoxy-D-xylulose-5-phosphate reductoisomerase